MTQHLLTLLQLGIGTGKAPDNRYETLLVLSIEQWKDLMDLAKRQGVGAIAFDGVQSLFEVYPNKIKAANESSVEWMRWVYDCTGMMTQYERLNIQQKESICKLADICKQNSLKLMVFKGQANASLYPESNHRAVGDIDCYMFGEADKGDQLLAGNGATVENNWYRHSKISFHDETIENHRVLCHTRGSKIKKRMEEELITLLLTSEMKHINGCGEALMPPVQFNAYFLTYHALHHFTSEGLRMKQILDWAMFIKACQKEVDWNAFNDFCKRYKLDRFAAVMNYIAVHHLGITAESGNLMMDGTYAEKILQSTLYDDEYLFNSGKSDWAVRWLLVKHMFGRDRWKNSEIARQNVLARLWQNATGFLFDKD